MSWTFFKESEFTCKCGCGLNNISHDLVDKLDEARGMYKKPMTIISGSRCKDHNLAVRGKRASAHLKGLAADIRCTTSQNRWKLLNIFFILGFTRIGLGKTFIHVDISSELPQEQAWHY